VRSLYERSAEALDRARTGDAFGPTPGAEPEPEPTALAAIALDDDAARRWLTDAQRPDGSFGLTAGPVENDAPTGLAALALPPGDERERALDHLVATPARTLPSDPVVPHDPNVPGWGWALGTAGWVEPTSRALLAFRRLRPGATTQIDGAVGFLADRECVGGGWNFGNRSVYYVDLPPFGQTTAAGLIGLHALESGYGLVLGGVDALRRLWPVERGPLTLAMSLAAFRLLGLSDADEVEAALERTLDGPAPDVIALAWTALASGPGLSELAVPP
jgi:hypothetical protein